MATAFLVIWVGLLDQGVGQWESPSRLQLWGTSGLVYILVLASGRFWPPHIGDEEACTDDEWR